MRETVEAARHPDKPFGDTPHQRNRPSLRHVPDPPLIRASSVLSGVVNLKRRRELADLHSRNHGKAEEAVRRFIAACTVASAAAITTSAGLPTASDAAASQRCANVLTRYIQATHVRTSGHYRCRPARTLLRRYFRKVVRTGQVDGGCAQVRLRGGCAVGNFLCTASRDGRRGSCRDGVRTVRFRERDFGSG